jgi:hypothetical protein
VTSGGRATGSRRSPRLEVLGWWFHERAPDDWPRPQWLVSRWRARDRDAVLRWLRAGDELVRYPATAPCRFACGVRHVGRRDLTDGTFVWPEGLAHYVAMHGVRLPAHFVAHVLGHDGGVAPFVVPKLRPGLYDAVPWRRWAREQRACVDLRGWQRPTPTNEGAVAKALAKWHGELAYEQVLLWRRSPRAAVVRFKSGELGIASLRRGGRLRQLAGWQQWQTRN